MEMKNKTILHLPAVRLLVPALFVLTTVALADVAPDDEASKPKPLILTVHQIYEQGDQRLFNDHVRNLDGQQVDQLLGELNYVDRQAVEQFGSNDHPLADFFASLRKALLRRQLIEDARPVEEELNRSTMEMADGATVIEASSSGSGGGGDSSSLGGASDGGGGGSTGGGGAGGGGGGAGSADAGSVDVPIAGIGNAGTSNPYDTGTGLTQTTAQAFPVYDGLLHEGKPTSSELGLRDVRIIYANTLFPNNAPRDEPIEQAVRDVARSTQPGAMVVLDIEHWRMENWLVDGPAQRERNIDRLIQVIEWFREENPTAKIGYYSILPPGWRSRHDEKLSVDIERSKRLADHVDFIAPSFYSSSENFDDWKRNMDWRVRQSRTYGKPVYAFLWARFHNANAPAPLRGKLLPADFWRAQLEYARKHTDGAIIWGGYQEIWDPSEDWVGELNEFLAEPMPVNWAD